MELAIIITLYTLAGLGVLSMYSGLVYILWKLLGVIRYIEFSEAKRNYPVYQTGGDLTPRTIDPGSFVRGNVSKKDQEGSFVMKSEEEAYYQEEAGKVSIAAGVSDEEAINIVMEQIRKQNESKGTVANV
jgi:hypothetical protein